MALRESFSHSSGRQNSLQKDRMLIRAEKTVAVVEIVAAMIGAAVVVDVFERML